MMKKLFALFIGLGIILGIFSKEVSLMAEAYLGNSTTHTVKKGESLSLIAKQYYGDPYLWKELSLVNMAPNPDLILPGEQITIPSAETIHKLNEAKTISTVKDLVVVEETALNKSPEPEKDSQLTMNSQEQPNSPDSETTEDEVIPLTIVEEDISAAESEAAGFPWIWLIAAVFLIGGLIGLAMYRRRQNIDSANPNDVQETKPVLVVDSELESKSKWDWSEIDKSADEEHHQKRHLRKKERNKKKEETPIEIG